MAYELTNNGPFDVGRLLLPERPISTKDPDLLGWVQESGGLYVNNSIVGVRPAEEGEVIEIWLDGPEGKYLQRTALATGGDLVAVGGLGEQFITSKAALKKGRRPVDDDGLKDHESLPPFPDDGHVYRMWRADGEDYRVAVDNPHKADIYLQTPGGSLRIGLPESKIVSKVIHDDDEIILGGAKLITKNRFDVSYRLIDKDANKALQKANDVDDGDSLWSDIFDIVLFGGDEDEDEDGGSLFVPSISIAGVLCVAIFTSSVAVHASDTMIGTHFGDSLSNIQVMPDSPGVIRFGEAAFQCIGRVANGGDIDDCAMWDVLNGDQ